MSSTTNKRNSTKGFSSSTITERLSGIKKYGTHWRKVDLRTVVMTTLIQKWSHTSGLEDVVKHLCPWGMQSTLAKFYLRKVCKNYTSIPSEIKESFPDLLSSKDVYNAEEWTLTVSNTGPQEPKKYHRLYCQHCKDVKIPAIIIELGERLQDKTLDSLISNWDVLKLKDAYIDYIGCFLPWEGNVHAGPNARKYIRDQSEHPKTSHMYTVATVTKKRQLSQAALTAHPPAKTLALEPKVPSDIKQYAIVGKGTKKQCLLTMDNYLNKINLLGNCSRPMQKLGKGFCLHMVHIGTNKMISQNAIIDNYEAGFTGMQSYYESSQNIVRTTHPTANLPPPVKVALNDHNIIKAQGAILQAYRKDPTSIYKKLDESPYYSIMHDGIIKFGCEYNGVFMRGIDKDNEPLSVPHCLSKMKGGVTGYDTAHEIIRNIADVMGVKDTAFHSVSKEIRNYVPVEVTVDPKPPDFFKLGILASVDHENKTITITVDSKYPVGNIGDGVSVNTKAARLLRVLFGLLCPDYRCAVHVGSGVIKRLTTSKTMNVEEVTTFYECLRTIVSHFETSVKNKEVLDECMEILEMTPIHLISWCATRMIHFLKACGIFEQVLPAVHDAMFTKGIRVDERDLLFTANNISIMILMAELYPVFCEKYLRKADKGDLLVSTVYGNSVEFADHMQNHFKTPKADAFVKNMILDNFGNLIGTATINEVNKHTMNLNHPHKPSRKITEEKRLQNIKDECTGLKDKILKNIVSNIKDQCDEETFFYNWSGLDLSMKITIEMRKERLNELVSIFCTEREHVVSKYSDKKETKIEPDLWEGYEVTLRYPKKIDCTVDELMDELDDVFKAVGAMWLHEVNAARAGKREKKQMNVWKLFLKNRALEFPCTSQLIQLMIATSGNTSPVERAYTLLQIITAKRRNRVHSDNLETLFMLATLKVPLKKPEEYEEEIKVLAKTDE